METFHPISADADAFVMDWELAKGGSVPAHFHAHMSEHFSVTEGEAEFIVKGEKIVKRAGEELFVPLGDVDGICNKSMHPVRMRVTYSPASDTRRMFEIIVALTAEAPRSAMNMVKYFYVAPRIGLKPFSTPSPAFINGLLNGIASFMGFVGGWKKYVRTFGNT
ncbi:MAG TPA: cupin domain-containing protein [Chitinophagales bacterium]|nr:cupin domain-containing protein [Chitinophagales bacterium]